jgi:integrative and conjugative element protein (TIGR02256 family)
VTASTRATATLASEPPAADAGSGPALWVYADVARRLLSLRAAPWEVGGWVLGYWTGDESTLVVTHATPPGPRGTPFGVRISGRGHRARFDAAWRASGGHVTFLGDWHTHPGGPPLPSERDRGALKQLATGEQFGTPRPLALIVANRRWPWSTTQPRLAAYLRQTDGELVLLAAELFDELPPSAVAVPAWHWPDRR